MVCVYVVTGTLTLIPISMFFHCVVVFYSGQLRLFLFLLMFCFCLCCIIVCLFIFFFVCFFAFVFGLFAFVSN